MAKEYDVCLPITGTIWVTVEADSEAEAIDAALGAELYRENIEEWEVHKQVVQGNFFRGQLNRAVAECVGGDDDD